MYNMSTRTYGCDICGFEMEYDDYDEVHGEMWECEKCGKTFCTKCFVDALGLPALERMFKKSDRVLCADCFAKENAE